MTCSLAHSLRPLPSQAQLLVAHTRAWRISLYPPALSTAASGFGTRAPPRSSLEAVGNFVGRLWTGIRMATSAGTTGPAFSPQEKWWTPQTVAVVTGANKGIGYSIAQGLADAGLTTVVASRDPSLGEAAVEKLRSEGRENVVFHQLDITNKDSVDSFAKWIEKEYKGLDILVNNAGFAYKGNTFGADEAQATIATNYQGTRAVTEALLPLLRPSPEGARIVNVSSQAGLLSIVGPELRKRLTAPDLTLAQLDGLAEEFVSAIRDGTFAAKGWPKSMYGISKVLESAYTRVLAKQLDGRPADKRVFVNAVCPGWCATDMSSHSGPRTAEQGADTPIYLSLMPGAKCQSGKFFFDRAERSF